jgi:hypothetical protein
MAFDQTTAHRAAQEMKRSGGDFISRLGATFMHADLKNQRRMYEAFQPEFDQYYEYYLAREQRDAQHG